MRSRDREVDFSHSLTDLMSGVAVMFLVIAAIFMVQASQARTKAQAEKTGAEERARENSANASRYKELDAREKAGVREIEKLKASLEGNSNIDLVYDPKRDPRLLTIVFNRDNLRFASGDCQVGDPARDSLRTTLREIFPQICASVGPGLQKSITLEGHTDNRAPLEARCGVAIAAGCGLGAAPSDVCKTRNFENNVRLSAARAQYVFFQARDALRDDQLVAQCLDRNFLVAGRGPIEPLDGKPWDIVRSPVDDARNRRVVIKVRVSLSATNGASP